MEWEVVGGALLIFTLRVIGNMMTTFRLVLMVRGEKIWSSVLAMIEAFIFAVTLGSVVANLSDVWNMTAYCGGFAAGGYLGLILEDRLVQRFVSVQLISKEHAHELADCLRNAGFGATESIAYGAQGEVGMVTCAVPHREVKQVVAVAEAVDPDVFVMMDDLRGISHGYFRRLARHAR